MNEVIMYWLLRILKMKEVIYGSVSSDDFLKMKEVIYG